MSMPKPFFVFMFLFILFVFYLYLFYSSFLIQKLYPRHRGMYPRCDSNQKSFNCHCLPVCLYACLLARFARSARCTCMLNDTMLVMWLCHPIASLSQWICACQHVLYRGCIALSVMAAMCQQQQQQPVFPAATAESAESGPRSISKRRANKMLKTKSDYIRLHHHPCYVCQDSKRVSGLDVSYGYYYIILHCP